MALVFQLLPRRARRGFRALAVALGVGALLEAVSVSAVVPLVALITAPTAPEGSWLARLLYQIAPARGGGSALLLVAAAVVAIFVLKNIYLALVSYKSYRFVCQQQVESASAMFATYLHRDYAAHMQHNSAHLLRDIDSDVRAMHQQVLRNMLALVSEILVAVVLCALLVLLDPLIALGALAAAAIIGLLSYRFVSRRTDELGYVERETRGEMNASILQGLGAFKVVKLLGIEQFFVDSLARAGRRHAAARVAHHMLKTLPAYLFEVVGVLCLMAVLFVGALRGSSLTAMLPLLAAFVVAAVKLAPSLNRTLQALAAIRHFTPSARHVAQILTDGHGVAAPSRTDEPSTWPDVAEEREIRLEKVSFRYPGATRDAIDEVDFRVGDGEAVALLGPSGAGKSTLAELLLRLLTPTAGRLTVDGHDVGDEPHRWRRQVGYVPQEVYLVDDSLRRNIAFGLDDEEIVETQVTRAVAAAQLQSLVERLPNGLDTWVGERGSRLSAGELQRVGIARGLYRPCRLLVLDEPTAALDPRTEGRIATTIAALRERCSIVVIAHRVSTARVCDRVVMIANGRIEARGTYDELIESCEAFRSLIGEIEHDAASDVATGSDDGQA